MKIYEIVVIITIFKTGTGVLTTDPCLSPKQINNVENRGTNCIATSSSLICDRNGFDPGWYAAVLNGEYLQMPNQHPKSFACGTESPIWISGQHPSVEGSISNVTGCIRGFQNNDKCLSSFFIKIKKCSGFFVYNLPYVDLCYRGYCFGNHTCESKPISTTTVHNPETTSIPMLPPSDPCMYAVTLPSMSQRGIQCSAVEAKNSGLLCDRTLEPKWYKAVDNDMFHDMPTSCVSTHVCGTEEPIWLNGSLPSFADGSVVRKACVRGSGLGECCKTTLNIIIRNCFTYNVYKLPYTQFCNQAYCFGDRGCIKEGSSPHKPSHNKSPTDLPYILIGCLFGVMLGVVGTVVFVIKTKRTRIGQSHEDIKKSLPPPYSPPNTGYQVTVNNGQISLKK